MSYLKHINLIDNIYYYFCNFKSVLQVTVYFINFDMQIGPHLASRSPVAGSCVLVTCSCCSLLTVWHTTSQFWDGPWSDLPPQSRWGPEAKIWPQEGQWAALHWVTPDPCIYFCFSRFFSFYFW